MMPCFAFSVGGFRRSLLYLAGGCRVPIFFFPRFSPITRLCVRAMPPVLFIRRRIQDALDFSRVFSS